MEWTAFNNGVIEFCQHRHGRLHGLEDRKMFHRARQHVLDTGLVEVTRDGGRNLPALYPLTCTRMQAQPPIQAQLLRVGGGGGRPSVRAETGGSEPLDWGSTAPKESEPLIKITRASDLGKNKTLTKSGRLIEGDHGNRGIAPSFDSNEADLTMPTFGNTSVGAGGAATNIAIKGSPGAATIMGNA